MSVVSESSLTPEQARRLAAALAPHSVTGPGVSGAVVTARGSCTSAAASWARRWLPGDRVSTLSVDH